jgi:Zn-dependent protease
LTKNRVISRYVLLVLVLVWGYILAKPKYPFAMDWYITIVATMVYGFIGISIQRSIQDHFSQKAGDVSLVIQKKSLLYYLRSLDILGFLCFPIFGMGWGNPTTSPKALTGNKRWQRVRIILSGPIVILLVAILSQLCIYPVESFSLALAGQIALFAKINFYLFFFTLLPIPPLHGWLVWKALRGERVKIDKESFFGEIILVLAMITYIIPWMIESISRGFMYWI